MIRFPLGGAWVAAGVACFGLAACGDGGGTAPRTLALAECRLPRLAVAAQCGTIEVPENRDAPQGRKLTLTVAVLPANTLAPRPDPLFILAGGPGQAATFLGPFAAQMTDVRKDRDIVLVDQRGTGRSSPLSCRALREEETFVTAFNIDIVPRAADCAKELAALGVDAAQYTTAAWVEDLDAVRAALGYAKINLWGGSYGTRAALEYLRRHADRVRSAVLDGVAPPSMIVSFDIWPARDRAIDRIIEGCKGSPPCRSAHPDLAATLASIRARLGAAGRDVPVTDPRTGAVETLHVTFDHVVAALQPLTYVPELAALMPEVIGRAAAGDYGPLFAASLLVTVNVTEQMNAALHYSVICAEDVPRLSLGGVRSALEGVRSQALARRTLAVCNVWPRGRAPLDATAPVYSDVPVLILSGALDPVTPPANGAEVARTLTHSRHIVARGFGHIVSAHACAPRLIASFLDDPTFVSLPATCVARLESSEAPAPWPDRWGAMIAIDGLAKAFGRRGEVKAVAGVSFAAPDGEITGLLGPNGAGKTTLLRMLATLMMPDAGRATIDGHDVVADRFAVRRQIGVLSDARGLYPRLTGRENIRYFGALHGLAGSALEARIDTLIGVLGLAEVAERRAQGYSQGERMKVAIARALVHDPHTLLLDEPTNGLDILSTRALRELLRRLRASGKCLLFSSHVMQEVTALCDRIVILGRGQVVATGTAAELVTQSGAASLEDAFVALLGTGEGLAA